MMSGIPDEVYDKYFSYDARVASFLEAQTVIKSRTPSHAKVPKTTVWPHKSLDPKDV